MLVTEVYLGMPREAKPSCQNEVIERAPVIAMLKVCSETMRACGR